MCLYLLGAVNECVDVLVEAGRIPEAAFFARTYAPSEVARVVELWRAELRRLSNNWGVIVQAPQAELFAPLGRFQALAEMLYEFVANTVRSTAGNEGMKFFPFVFSLFSFILGQHPFRTGLLKVGMPGAAQGVQAKDPTIAELLKPLGYATAQVGKNHLGDRNEFLPTVHGFDEFYGNLYHLNAEEEPELPDYPKDPAFRAKFGPRGVLDCKASDKDDPTVDPRFGKVGKQVCKDTGPLTKKRMETIDDDIASRAADFIQRQNKAGKPAFV